VVLRAEICEPSNDSAIFVASLLRMAGDDIFWRLSCVNLVPPLDNEPASECATALDEPFDSRFPNMLLNIFVLRNAATASRKTTCAPGCRKIARNAGVANRKMSSPMTGLSSFEIASLSRVGSEVMKFGDREADIRD
jgi:hypothetical protein